MVKEDTRTEATQHVEAVRGKPGAMSPRQRQKVERLHSGDAADELSLFKGESAAECVLSVLLCSANPLDSTFGRRGGQRVSVRPCRAGQLDQTQRQRSQDPSEGALLGRRGRQRLPWKPAEVPEEQHRPAFLPVC